MPLSISNIFILSLLALFAFFAFRYPIQTILFFLSARYLLDILAVGFTNQFETFPIIEIYGFIPLGAAFYYLLKNWKRIHWLKADFYALLIIVLPIFAYFTNESSIFQDYWIFRTSIVPLIYGIVISAALHREYHLKKLDGYLMLFSTILVFLSIYSWITKDYSSFGAVEREFGGHVFTRFGGIAGEITNAYALMLLLGIFFNYYLFKKKKGPLKILLIINSSILLIFMGLTLSRMAIISLIFAIVVWNLSLKSLKASNLIFVITLIFISTFILSFLMKSVFISLGNEFEKLSTGDLSAGTGRYGYWLAILYSFTDFTFPQKLFGIGIANISPNTTEALWRYFLTPRGKTDSTENYFLYLLIGGGITMLMLYILYLKNVIQSIYRIFKKSQIRHEKEFALFTLGIFFAFLVQITVADFGNYSSLSVFYYIFFFTTLRIAYKYTLKKRVCPDVT